MPRFRGAFTAVAVAAALLATACGSEEGSAATTSASGTPPAESHNDGSTEPAAKVSANDASPEELRASLAAAGVKDPQRWAAEVEKYRPYPVDDPELTKLRNELAKDNPDPGMLEKILGALQP